MFRLAAELDWGWIDRELTENYAEEGHPSVPIRTMVGMLLLKQIFESDQSVLRRWLESPYWQHFTGEVFFHHRSPFDLTDFVYFRKCDGEAGMEFFLPITLTLCCFASRYWIKSELIKNKRYSLHEPAVWCIAKGKAHKKYEFASLDQAQRVREANGGNSPSVAVTDCGFQGSKLVGGTRILTPGKSSADRTYYRKTKERRSFRRRVGIEPVIGHLKNDHRMRRNFLAGELGDAVNWQWRAREFALEARRQLSNRATPEPIEEKARSPKRKLQKYVGRMLQAGLSHK